METQTQYNPFLNTCLQKQKPIVSLELKIRVSLITQVYVLRILIYCNS